MTDHSNDDIVTEHIASYAPDTQVVLLVVEEYEHGASGQSVIRGLGYAWPAVPGDVPGGLSPKQAYARRAN